MSEAPSDLPNDVAELQAIIALRDAVIDLTKQKLSILETEIRERNFRIELLDQRKSNEDEIVLIQLPHF